MGDRKKDLSADNVFVRKYIRILHSTPRCILRAFLADNSAERYREKAKILADMKMIENCRLWSAVFVLREPLYLVKWVVDDNNIWRFCSMVNRSAKIDQKADLIWAIADKLTGVYKPHEYGEVILPLTVIRRFDCILSDTKDAVLAKNEEVKNLPMKDVLLRKASGFDFYNTSKYTFERLVDDPDHIEENFRDYLNGFSDNVQDIISKFKFDGHITTMDTEISGCFQNGNDHFFLPNNNTFSQIQALFGRKELISAI